MSEREQCNRALRIIITAHWNVLSDDQTNIPFQDEKAAAFMKLEQILIVNGLLTERPPTPSERAMEAASKDPAWKALNKKSKQLNKKQRKVNK